MAMWFWSQGLEEKMLMAQYIISFLPEKAPQWRSVTGIIFIFTKITHFLNIHCSGHFIWIKVLFLHFYVAQWLVFISRFSLCVLNLSVKKIPKSKIINGGWENIEGLLQDCIIYYIKTESQQFIWLCLGACLGT